MLRLTIWFRDPIKREGRVVFRTATCDLGDSQASLALRVAHDKYIATNCQTKLAKLVSEDPFADNYLFSGRSKEEVAEAIIELINLHKRYGIPLKIVLIIWAKSMIILVFQTILL